MSQHRNDMAVEQFHTAMQKLPKWLLSIVCVAVILWLTLAPHPFGDEELPMFPGADKIVHGVMFFGLTLSLLFDTLRYKHWHHLSLPLIAAMSLASMGLGILIEVVQPLFGRGFEYWDMGVDITGAILGGALWTLFGGGLELTERERLKERQPSGSDNNLINPNN